MADEKLSEISKQGESDEELEKTLVDVNTPALSNTQVCISSEQFNSLIAGINTLRSSVQELRDETSRSQNQLQQLQAKVNDNANNINQSQNPMTHQLPLSSSTGLSTGIEMTTSLLPPKQLIPPSSSSFVSPPVYQQLPIVSPAVQLPEFTKTLPLPSSQTSYQPPKSLLSNPTSSYMFQQTAGLPQIQQNLPMVPNTDHITTISSQPELTTPIARRVTTFVDDAAANLYPLPQFSGDPEEWPLFFANYQDTTMEFRYSDRQNVMRLQRALKGNAKESVSSMLLYAENLPHIIEELHFNFGRPDLLVDAQLTKVQQFPAISENRLENILPLSNRVRNMVAFFKSANCAHQLSNPTLLRELINKLPPSKQYEWAKHAVTISPFPTLETFAEWITALARVVCLMPTKTINNVMTSHPPPIPLRQHANASHSRPTPPEFLRRVLHSTEPEQMQNMCILCSQQHRLSDCQHFNALDVNDKWIQVKQNRLCFSCLQKGHNLTSCFRKKPCGINGCTRFHHQSLHQESRSSTSESQQNQQVLNCRQGSQCSQLFKILPVVLSGPLGSVSAHAMFDEGSSVTLLEENIASQLGLRGQSLPLTLQWYGDKTTTEASKKVPFYIKGQDNDAESYMLSNVHTVLNLNLPIQTFYKESYAHMKEIPIINYKNAKPVLLIGLDNCYLGVHKDVVEDGPQRPIAAGTKLGWVAYGPVSTVVDVEPRVFHVRRSEALQRIERLVEEYFQIESFGVKRQKR